MTRIRRIIAASLVALIATGCSDDVEQPLIPEYPPSGGSLVNRASIIGAPSLETTIVEMISDGNVGFYFAGLYNGERVVGRLATDGTIVWTTPTGFSVDDIVRMPAATGPLANALVAAGWSGNGNEEAFRGVVSLYSHTGAALDTLEYVGTNDKWLRSAILTSQSPPSSFECVTVGGTEVGDILHPMTIRFGVTSPGTLSKLEENILADTDAVFAHVVPQAGQPVAGHFVIASLYPGGSFEGSAIWHLTDLQTVSWQTGIAGQVGEQPFLDSARWINSTIVAVGNVRVTKREKSWPTALAVCLSQTGSINWIQSWILSDHEDDFSSCFVIGGEIIAVGQYGSFQWINTKRRYGLGLLAKINPATGDLTASRTFGGSSYSSKFNAVLSDGTLAFTAGWTKGYIAGFGYQGWLAEIRVSEMTGNQLAPPPELTDDVVLPASNRIQALAPMR